MKQIQDITSTACSS